MIKKVLTPHEETKVRLRSDRIARTLVSSVMSIENLYVVLGSFMQSAINELGWWAGQAWLKKEDSLTPTGWVFATSAPSSILGISRLPTTDTSGFGSRALGTLGTEEFSIVPAILVPIAELTWHPYQQELKSVGVRHCAIVDVMTAQGLGLRILFILPNQNAFNVSTQTSLEGACVLLPELYGRAIASQLLVFQSSHDALTGLLNRRGLEAAYAKSDAWNSQDVDRTIFFLDLDRFKDINDTYGHPVGDEVLCELARRITRASRPVDSQARLGGDEFLIVVENLDDWDSVERTADRYLDAIQKDFTTSQGSTHQLRISLGVAGWPANTEISEAIARADAQMYRAKASGGHRAKIEELYLRNSESYDRQDSFQFNNSFLSVSKVRRNINDDTIGFIATFTLPNAYSPEMMQDLARQIRLAILSDISEATLKHDLLLHVERPRRSDKTNIELLLTALSQTYSDANLHFVLDLEGISVDSANIARDLVGSSHVKVALANFGLGIAEIALTKEFVPTYFIANSALVTSASPTSEIALKAIIAISQGVKIPLIFPGGKSPQTLLDMYRVESNLGQSLYVEPLTGAGATVHNQPNMEGLS